MHSLTGECEQGSDWRRTHGGQGGMASTHASCLGLHRRAALGLLGAHRVRGGRAPLAPVGLQAQAARTQQARARHHAQSDRSV